MHYDYDTCRDVLLRSLTEALEQQADRIRELEARTRADGRALNGMSFDVLPWHPTITVSFRSSADSEQFRYEPGDWQGYALIGPHNAAKPLAPAMQIVGAAYVLAGDEVGQESNHLIQLAAADAILDPKVAQLLQECGVRASIITDSIPYGLFEFVVVDEDRVFRANYCEIVVAMRVARRLLGRAIP